MEEEEEEETTTARGPSLAVTNERGLYEEGGREGGRLRSYSFLGPDLSLSLSLERAGRVVFLFDGSSEKRIL